MTESDQVSQKKTTRTSGDAIPVQLWVGFSQTASRGFALMYTLSPQAAVFQKLP